MLDQLPSGSGWAYVKVFLLLMAGAFGLPIPEDFALLFAGVLIHDGDAHLIAMGILCYVGIVLGDLIIFRIGYLTGPRILRRKKFRKIFTAQRLHWIRENLEKRSFLTIVLARHLFYLRTATFLMCGAVRMSFTRFLIFDALAALITAPVMLGLGYFGAQHYEAVLEALKKIKFLTFLGIVLAVGIWFFLRRRKSPAAVHVHGPAPVADE